MEKTDQQNFAKETSYSTKLKWIDLSSIFQLSIFERTVQKNMRWLYFLFYETPKDITEIRDTKTNYHNHFNLFISHRKVGVYWDKIRNRSRYQKF